MAFVVRFLRSDMAHHLGRDFHTMRCCWELGCSNCRLPSAAMGAGWDMLSKHIN